jgi:Domain of unknown function (DUF3854)/Helix-turn-helix domain
MSSVAKHPVVAWRNLIRDDEALSPRAKFVGLVLATYMGKAGTCFPSGVTIAKACGWKEVRSVSRATKELEEREYLEITRRPNTSNLYEAMFPDRTPESSPDSGLDRRVHLSSYEGDTEGGTKGDIGGRHARLLRESGISEEVAAARGYRSILTAGELIPYAFSASQRLAPGLLIPIHGVDGSVVLYQFRPDHPRKNEKGKPVKYETPYGSRMRVDVPPLIRRHLGNPSVPLFVTEGVRKADAAVSHGLCCIALLGVWNWRGKNENGGKTALACFESVAFNNRDTYIAFDSDVSTKPEVALALERLRKFLESRGARVHVLYLPAGPNGAKVGLDDYLANGGSVEHLKTLTRAA